MDCDLQTLTADGRNRTCFRQGLHHGIPNVVPFGNTSAFGGLFRHGTVPALVGARHGAQVSWGALLRSLARHRRAKSTRYRCAALPPDVTARRTRQRGTASCRSRAAASANPVPSARGDASGKRRRTGRGSPPNGMRARCTHDRASRQRGRTGYCPGICPSSACDQRQAVTRRATRAAQPDAWPPAAFARAPPGAGRRYVMNSFLAG